MKQFKKILRMTQQQLKLYIYEQLLQAYTHVDFSDGYVYAKGEIPIMLVAHMDTVHKQIPKDILFDKQCNLMWSPQGIGGDDRCGVFGLLTIVKKGYRPHILFTEDEEIGCVGANKFTVQNPKLDTELKYIIEMDRRGKDDCVFYDCGNVEFAEYISSFGFTEDTGSFSDICTLSQQYDVASVNLSSGYYNEHTKMEYINVGHMYSTINKIIKMLKDEQNAPYFDYEQLIFNYGYVPGVYATYNNYMNADYIKQNQEYNKQKTQNIEIDDVF